jgi:hypothetical protein
MKLQHSRRFECVCFGEPGVVRERQGNGGRIAKKRRKRHRVSSDRDSDAGSCITVAHAKDKESTFTPCLRPVPISHQRSVNTSEDEVSSLSTTKLEPDPTEVSAFSREGEIPSASNLHNERCEGQEPLGASRLQNKWKI